MKTLAMALAALACSVPAAVDSAEPLAPPAKRAPAPAAPNAQRPAAAASAQDYYAALGGGAAAQQGGEAELNGGMMRAMSHLIAAGRCTEAANLATRDGRPELAAKAKQICRPQ
jgi:hypothetical protein